MTRVLRLEARRSAALGAALALVVVGVVLLTDFKRFGRPGWMSAVLDQRLALIVLWPVALAAGAWQGRREHRAGVGELFSTTPLPRRSRALPTAVVLGSALVVAYLLTALVPASSVALPQDYVPLAVPAVLVVGALSLVAAAWLGLGIGRFLPHLVTAPVLTVVGFGVLLSGQALGDGQRWIAAALSPVTKPASLPDYFTVPASVILAQSVWLAALAGAGLVLVSAGGRRTVASAGLLAVLGAGVALATVPHTTDPDLVPDPDAVRLVCADGGPRVCVTRVHAALLPATTPLAREGLALLSRLPGAPTAAVEDYGWLEPARQPQRRDVVLVDPELFAATGGGGGGLEGAADEHLDAAAQAENFLVRMLSGAGTGTRYCAGATVSDRAARAAAAYWLLRKEPATGPGGEQPDERAL